MGQFLLLLSAALVVGAIVFGVAVLISGDDPGLVAEEPEGRAVPLPSARPLVEDDLGGLRFDTALRGYRMSQVDVALRRAAYDLGFKEELVGVLEAEVTALRDGRLADADALRASRQAALGESALGEAELGESAPGESAFPDAALGKAPFPEAADADLDADFGVTRGAGREDDAASSGDLPTGSDPLSGDPSAPPAAAEPSERTTGVW